MEETLGDAAENKYPIENTGVMFMPNPHEVTNIYRQEGFIAGANWQAKRMYSEEDLRQAYEHGMFSIIETGHGDTFEEWFKKK